MQRLIIFFTLAPLLWLLSTCSTVPVTGRNSLSLVSDSEILRQSETQYQGFVAKAKREGKLITDPRVEQIAQRLIRATESYLAEKNHLDIWRQMRWELQVVRSPEVNAFCMPGGKIVVYTGLLSMIGLNKGADDELAAVIGHEIAHAIARHAAERISRAHLKGLGADILSSIIGRAIGGDAGSTLMSGTAGALISVLYGLGTELGFTLPFNRKQELEADKIGMVLMALSGYDPKYALSLWQKMAQQAGDKSHNLWSTHPSEEKRIKEIQKYMPRALTYYKQEAITPKTLHISTKPLPHSNRTKK